MTSASRIEPSFRRLRQRRMWAAGSLVVTGLFALWIQAQWKKAAAPVPPTGPAAPGPIRFVFVIAMENRNREEIESGRDAPYLSGSVWPRASYATEYFNPPKVHPSLPNYLWLIAGDDYGKGLDDSDPSVGGDELATENHLPGLLARAGWTWREYAEGIDGKHCPLASAGGYLCKHNPFVYFDGLTGGLNPDDGLCRAHNRPFSELAADLAGGRVANFNFITPDRCHDMHDCATRSGDDWLSRQLPPILASRPYREAGAVFIVWDEGSDGSDGPLPFAVLSPFAKGGGYHDAVHYDHSSTLKTVQEIFGLSPLLGHAADPSVEDLSDLFQPAVIRGRGSLPARTGADPGHVRR